MRNKMPKSAVQRYTHEFKMYPYTILETTARVTFELYNVASRHFEITIMRLSLSKSKYAELLKSKNDEVEANGVEEYSRVRSHTLESFGGSLNLSNFFNSVKEGVENNITHQVPVLFSKCNENVVITEESKLFKNIDGSR